MQKTWKGQSARVLLRTAVIEQMAAGNYEIVITDRDQGRWLAHSAERQTGWGAPVLDLLCLSNAGGERLYLSTSARALPILERLEREREAKQSEHNEVTQ